MQIERPEARAGSGGEVNALTDESVKHFTSAEHTHGGEERQRAKRIRAATPRMRERTS